MPLVTLQDLNQSPEQLAPYLELAQSLGGLWTEFIKQDDDPHSYTVIDGGERERAAGIHASELSTCLVKVVYSMLGAERRTDPQALDSNMKLRFRTGTSLHGMIQSDFARLADWYTKNNAARGLALSFERELPVTPEYQELARQWGIHSSCDGRFIFYQLWQEQWVPILRLLLEIKSSSDKQFEDRKKPEAKHLEQTCLYQACLDTPLAWVLYYNKSNSNFTPAYAPWLIKFDRNLWERGLLPRFELLHHHAATRSMPERTEGNHCRWCPFTYLCKPKILERNNRGPVIISGGLLARRSR